MFLFLRRTENSFWMSHQIVFSKIFTIQLIISPFHLFLFSLDTLPRVGLLQK